MPRRAILHPNESKSRRTRRAAARRRRILIVPDKFKGTLTAHAAASAIASGWSDARPADLLEILPMTDGGDGFGAVMGELMSARRKQIPTKDAAHRPLRAEWWLEKAGRTAIIDSAGIIGLAMLPPGKFHPFQLDTFGLGTVMKAAAKAGAATALIGIGGSATNDGGFGMARALGWKFFDDRQQELTEWWQLRQLSEVHPPPRPLSMKITVAVDVGNPLLGPKGCSRIYGPQKGLRGPDFELAEKSLSRLAAASLPCAKIPGAGAAGGLGFGLMAFAKAKMDSGFEIFARYARLEERICQADVVITGEGRIDQQTYMGKGVGQIAQRCRKLAVPCLALAGLILEPARARKLFARARALTQITSLPSAQASPAQYLRELARQTAAGLDQ